MPVSLISKMAFNPYLVTNRHLFLRPEFNPTKGSGEGIILWKEKQGIENVKLKNNTGIIFNNLIKDNLKILG